MAFSSHGAVLAIVDGESSVAVGEVRDITGPSMRREVEAVVSADPLAPPVPIISHTTPDEVSFEINYTAHAVQQRLRLAAIEMTTVPFELTFPTTPSEIASFDGYVSEFEPLAPVEGVLRANVIVTLASTIDFRSDT